MCVRQIHGSCDGLVLSPNLHALHTPFYSLLSSRGGEVGGERGFTLKTEYLEALRVCREVRIKTNHWVHLNFSNGGTRNQNLQSVFSHVLCMRTPDSPFLLKDFDGFCKGNKVTTSLILCLN